MTALALAIAIATAPVQVHGLDSIGSFHVRGGTLRDARAALGAPATTREERGGCALAWPGLKLRFYTLLYDRQCRADSAFESAEIAGLWRTERGLRRGDTVGRARALYPKAHTVRRAFGPSALGLIVTFSPAIGDYGLAVRTHAGRVTTLMLLDPQGGE